MGVRRLQYSQELEKQLAKDKSLKAAHKKAAEKARIKKVKAKKAEANLIAKAKKKLVEVFGKKKTVKPTASEKKVVKKRLKKKYPLMAQAGWGKPKRKRK